MRAKEKSLTDYQSSRLIAEYSDFSVSKIVNLCKDYPYAPLVAVGLVLSLEGFLFLFAKFCEAIA